MNRAVEKESKLLIVDDLEDNIYILEGILQAAGYSSVKSTTDPREVITLYLEYKPDLVLLDLEMPYFDGFELMKMLKEVEHDSYVPVIILTARSEREIKLKALAEGARDFIVKPFDEIEVETRIRNQLEVRLLHNMVRDENEMLEEKVKERTKELEETRLEVIRRLGIAAEYRDNDTGYHIERIARMAELIALEIGLSRRQADNIRNASPMHDIGKIGIPDSILLKPGKLTDEEFEKIKEHTVIGSNILAGSRSELLSLAQSIARSHHEKWDGTGYPDGLAGEAIPLEARITSIVDIFDAMTSKRPYKEAWPVDKTVAEINGMSGKQLDPKLVEIFNRVLPEIVRIKDTV